MRDFCPVEEAVADQRKLLDRFNAISAAFAEPDADFDKLMDEQARVQEMLGDIAAEVEWRLDHHRVDGVALLL